MTLPPEVDTFLHAVTGWAASEPEIMGAVLVGSYARGEARFDSDIDIVILARDPVCYIEEPGWIRIFGQAERFQVEYYEAVTSLRVWYANGLEVEFGLSDPVWSSLPLDAGTRQVLADGALLLFERVPLLSLALKDITGPFETPQESRPG